MNHPEPKKQKSLFKIILISLASLFTLLIFFFALLFVLLLVYKDDITRTLLTSVNEKINGEISFLNLSFTPFRHFPNAALLVENLYLNESIDSINNRDKLPVFNVDKAYISFNLIDLVSSKINISKITFEGGRINIVVYPDSQTNIQKIIDKVDLEEKKVKQNFVQADTLESKNQIAKKSKTEFSLRVDNLELKDILLTAENLLKKNKLCSRIKELESTFSFGENQIAAFVRLDVYIDSLVKNDKILIADESIKLESNLEADLDSFYLKLEKGSITIGKAEFNFNGIFDSKKDGYIDISISGSDENFSLLTFLLLDEEIKSLKSGKIFFNGSLKGQTVIEFPSIDISFGLKDVNLVNPVTKREIKKLNLKGNFSSGNNEDWSGFELRIDTLYADLQNGALGMSALVKNLVKPEIDAIVYLSADVTGLEKVFKLGPISDLKGKIELYDRIKGRYDLAKDKFISEVNSAKLSLEDFGLKIPGTMIIYNINGSIRRDNDDIFFDDLKIISEDTDFLIDGNIANLPYLFFNVEKDIVANLNIKSSVFDLPNFLFFDPSIKRDFNHRLLDVDVSVTAHTTTSKATKFKSFPAIEFDIKKIHATTEYFLPRLEINSGAFEISENILGFNLKFRNFKTDFMKGKFNFSGEYNTSKYQPYYIKAETDFKDLYWSELFYSNVDTVPEFMQGKMAGNFFVELQFPTDSTVLKFVKLKDADLVYEFSKDTIIAENINLDFNNIYFKEEVNPNLFATAYFDGIVKARSLKSSAFNFNDIDFAVNATNGRYAIKSELVRLFGENAKGKAEITFVPFIKLPSYQLVLTNVQFQSENFMRTFMEDTLLTGPLHLSMNLQLTGSEWNSIVNNLKGSIRLSGENLLFIGMDADKLIEKFQRSQNFNLVDLGGVVLAGPIGLFVTKGSDYASLLITSSGEKTLIKKLVSNWDLNNGVFKIKDAAFSTNQNRIATTGYINFSKDSLDLTIALLNSFGCSVFSQRVYGNLNSPTMEKIKVVGTFLAPVTNLVDNILGKDCEVFYQGAVQHPK